MTCLTAGMVNLAEQMSFYVHFCVFFRVLGRILRFKNPVKYNYRSQINQYYSFARREFVIYFSVLCFTLGT